MAVGKEAVGRPGRGPKLGTSGGYGTSSGEKGTVPGSSPGGAEVWQSAE